MKNEYYKTKESVEEYIRLAKDVNGANLIEKLKDFLPVNSSLLEVGSGPGTDWRLLSESYNVIGSDNSLVFIEHLKDNNPNGNFLELDAISLNTDLKFDGIYSNKVLHHLNNKDLKLSIERQHDILKPNGIICHSFWKGVDSEIYNGLLVNYQNKDSVNELFSNCFDILLVTFYKEFEDSDSILLIGRKKNVVIN